MKTKTSDFFRPSNMMTTTMWTLNATTVSTSHPDVTTTETTNYHVGRSSVTTASKVTTSTEARSLSAASSASTLRSVAAKFEGAKRQAGMGKPFGATTTSQVKSDKTYRTTPVSPTQRGIFYGTDLASIDRCSQDLLSLRHRLKRFYETKKVNATSVQMLCLPNFHWVAGSTYAHCLRNGSWSGTETVCEVDYFKHRLRLSIIIVLTCVIISGSFLCADFYCFVNRRSELRVEKTRILHFNNRRDFELGYNKRCMAYPIFGLSDLKLYLPEINQFVDIKPRSEYREMQERLQEQVCSCAQNEKSRGVEYERKLQSYRAALLTQKETYSNLMLVDSTHDGQHSGSYDHEMRSMSHHDSKVDNVQFQDDKDFGFASSIPPKKMYADSRKKTNFSRGLLLFRLRSKTYSRKDPAEKGYESA